VSFLIALQQSTSGLEQVRQHLIISSDPFHDRYGEHLSKATIDEWCSVPEHGHNVLDWLQENNVPDELIEADIDTGFIRIRGLNVVHAEQLLNTEYYAYTRKGPGADGESIIQIHRALEYSLPKHITASIAAIEGVHTLPAIQPLPHMTFTANAMQPVTPQFLANVYNVKDLVVSSPNSTNSIYASINQQFDPADLAAFQAQYNTLSTPIANIIGTNVPSTCSISADSCGEASLDVQQITTLAQNSTTWFWAMGSDESFVDWIVAVANNSDAPLIHSLSYGEPEAGNTPENMQVFSNEAMKLSARGFTLLVASGDNGAMSRSTCMNLGCSLESDFPACIPYVTTVGATQGLESGSAEVVCMSTSGGTITSGGGFSDAFSRPWYQDYFVKSYLANNGPMSGSQFNKNGRAYPDVALEGTNYPVIVGGQHGFVAGTSASTPVFAAMLTLINDAKYKAGQPSLGFVNPALYAMSLYRPDAFHDITQGNNAACAYNPNGIVTCPIGYQATVGYDAVTGVGSVNHAVLADLLMFVGPPGGSPSGVAPPSDDSGSFLGSEPVGLIILVVVLVIIAFALGMSRGKRAAAAAAPVVNSHDYYNQMPDPVSSNYDQPQGTYRPVQ
jgi:tripeptidyl-peptidase I